MPDITNDVPLAHVLSRHDAKVSTAIGVNTDHQCRRTSPLCEKRQALPQHPSHYYY